MRLLYVAPAPPSNRQGGGALRMFHQVRFLAQRFETDLIAPALEGSDEADRQLRQYCSDIEWIPLRRPSLVRRLARLGPYWRDAAFAGAIRNRLMSGRYGAVQLEKPAMISQLPSRVDVPIVLDVWAYGLAGPLRALRHEAGVIRRARNLVRLMRYGFFDRYCWPEIHCLLVVSEQDRARCERARPTQRVLVVPNGVDCAVVLPKEDYQTSRPVILFSGDMSFEPNIEAALFLATEVFPIVRREVPEAELRLVGRKPDPRITALAGNGVVVTGGVADILPHLHAATVFVAPHFTGAGTRTKLLEAMAAGLPIITTHVGVEGVKAQAGRELVIADNAVEMIESIQTLLASPGDRERFGRAARRLAEREYDWSQSLWPLESLYRDMLHVKAKAC